MAISERSELPCPLMNGLRRYVRPPQPVHFPSSEEAPETNRHLELRTALYQILKQELSACATIGSGQFVYYVPTTATKSLAPDVFVKLGQPHATFRMWKTWVGGAPDIAVEVVDDFGEGEECWCEDEEVLGESEADWEAKLERYRDAGIGEVVRFDPDDAMQPIRVWDHIDGDLVERMRPEDGVFECVCLGLFWVAVPHAAFVRVLRLARDREGRDLVPTPVEVEVRARREDELGRQEERRARQAAEQARDRLAAEVAELRRQLAARGSEAAARIS